jgi:hypothetical protein
MAIKYQDILTKLQTDPLSNDELVLLQQAEEHIDSEITKNFGKRYYEVIIEDCVIKFDYSMKTKKHIDIKQPRKELLQKELIKIYDGAGWKVEFSDDIDNSYATFRGKK